MIILSILRKFRFGCLWIIGMLVMLPFIGLGIKSFSPAWRWPTLIPHNWSIEAWQKIFSPHTHIWEVLLTSIWIAIVVTLINICLAIPAAEVLARSHFYGKTIVEAFLLLPIVVSPLVSTMGIHMTFIRIGLVDSAWGVILAHLVPTFPYMLRSLMISFDTLGFQWEEQAALLGARRLLRMREVVLPFIIPGLVVGSALSLIVSLSQYMLTFLIGGSQVMTLMLVMFPFVQAGDPTIAASYSILFAFLSVLMLYGSSAMLKKYYIGFSWFTKGN